MSRYRKVTGYAIESALIAFLCTFNAVDRACDAKIALSIGWAIPAFIWTVVTFARMTRDLN